MLKSKFCFGCGIKLNKNNRATQFGKYENPDLDEEQLLKINNPDGRWCIKCWKIEPPKPDEELQDFVPHCPYCGYELINDLDSLGCINCYKTITHVLKIEG